MGRLQEVVIEVEREKMNSAAVEDHEIIHGKDMCALLAWFMGWREDEARALFSISLAALAPRILHLLNLASVEQWIRRAA